MSMHIPIPTSLRVTLIQTSLVWENPDTNLELLENCLSGLEGQTDLVVLPEMFSTGFSMQPELYAESENGRVQANMQEWSKKLNAAVCGSVMFRDGNSFVNRFLWFGPDGKNYHYNKRHLFRMGEEQRHYSPGSDRIVIEYMGWRIAPFVCYDLRFPVWMRRTATFDYDLILVVANWPEKRMYHWNSLLPARAIENQSYLVAVNRVGKDGNGIAHMGASQVIDPMGVILWYEEKVETVRTVALDLNIIKDYRNSFPVGLDADNFVLNP